MKKLNVNESQKNNILLLCGNKNNDNNKDIWVYNDENLLDLWEKEQKSLTKDNIH